MLVYFTFHASPLIFPYAGHTQLEFQPIPAESDKIQVEGCPARLKKLPLKDGRG